MKPGRELDVLVAEKVMGLDIRDRKADPLVFPLKVGSIYYHRKFNPEDYSTDIAAAWMVVEKLNELGFGYCIEKSPVAEETTAWFVPKQNMSEGLVCTEDIVHISHRSDTAPHAICLAALKVVGVSN